MQRCGMETVVFEARQEVGGRVCTQRCPGFSTPLDLGASIITGACTRRPCTCRPCKHVPSLSDKLVECRARLVGVSRAGGLGAVCEQIRVGRLLCFAACATGYLSKVTWGDCCSSPQDSCMALHTAVMTALSKPVPVDGSVVNQWLSGQQGLAWQHCSSSSAEQLQVDTFVGALWGMSPQTSCQLH